MSKDAVNGAIWFAIAFHERKVIRMEITAKGKDVNDRRKGSKLGSIKEVL